MEPKNKSFHISKSQMYVLTSIRNGITVKLVINYTELKLDILTDPIDPKITKQLLLALIRRKLISHIECVNKDFTIIHLDQLVLTPLGNRMANIGLRPENVGKVIFAKAPTQNDIKASLGVLRNGKELEQDAKKKAKQSYNRKVNQSYKTQ